MPTLRQRKLAQKYVEAMASDKPMTMTAIQGMAGYSPVTTDKGASRTLEAKGVKEALEDLGFNVDTAKKVVAQIMTDESAKDKDRLTAADMTFKVHGEYAPEKNINLNLEAPLEGFDDIYAIAEGRSRAIREGIVAAIDERDGHGGSESEHPRLQPALPDKERAG